MADGRHFEKIENSSYLGKALTDFDKIWYGEAVLLLTVPTVKFSKI